LLIDAGELTFQNAIKRTRAISGLTQQKFADHRGVSVKVLKEIERGIANFTVNTLNPIASNFELDVSSIRKRPGPQQCPQSKPDHHQYCEPGFNGCSNESRS
jgi:transcriptional regulator with XRE-family HTH domain